MGENVAYRRHELRPRAVADDVAVAEYSATTLIPAEAKARVDDFGNLMITL